MIDFWVYILIIPGDIISIVMMSLLLLSLFNRRKFKTYKLDKAHRPTFSLIVPAHNEETVIARTIEAFIDTDYPSRKKEMIIVNDASTDNTEHVVAKYARKIIDTKTGAITINRKGRFNITLVNRTSGGHGKSFASNEGGNRAAKDTLYFIDADVTIGKDVFTEAAKHLGEPSLGAIGGYVIIRKNKSALNGFLRFESVMAQEVLRSGFNVIGVHYIIPGGCAIIKKKLWKQVGGYSSNSLAEDTDITWKILSETDQDIRFDKDIKVYADEPQTLISIWNQRLRWSRGNLQVTLNHSHKIGRLKYGKGMTHYYIFWISSIMVPVAFILASLGMGVAALFHATTQVLFNLMLFVGFSFYINWLVGAIVSRGHGALQGLVSPGLPLLFIFTSGLMYQNGLGRLTPYYHSHLYIAYGAWVLLGWLALTYIGTYFCVWLSQRPSKLLVKIAVFFQLAIFGYWILLVASVVEGYIREAVGAERKWIRTVR